jgi:hypothetical protein
MENESSPASRYDVLIGLQLKEDARYDLCSEAWRRVEAMLCRELAAYLGCARGKVALGSRTADAAEKRRECGLSVALANGFTPELKLALKFETSAAQSARNRVRYRDGSAFPRSHVSEEEIEATLDEIALAWTPEVTAAYVNEYSSHRRDAVVISLGIDIETRPEASVPFAYYPTAQGIPEPDEFVLALSTFGPDGAFEGNRDSRRAIGEWCARVERKLAEAIRKNAPERSAAAPPGEPSKPKWL